MAFSFFVVLFRYWDRAVAGLAKYTIYRLHAQAIGNKGNPSIPGSGRLCHQGLKHIVFVQDIDADKDENDPACKFGPFPEFSGGEDTIPKEKADPGEA